jgi:dephospho-CoA kinase
MGEVKEVNMFILGLTGSIGMGKSATAKMFAEEGVPVYDADAAVHRLYEGEATPAIEAAFPGTTANGKVDRDRLAKAVLGDTAAIKRLESIVHPLVHQARERFIAEAERSGAAIAVLDIPLLFETKGDARCDAVVVVSAPTEMQKTRAFERPVMSEEKLTAILANQIPDAQKRARADFVVDTSQGFDHARMQVRDILKRVGTMPKRQR